MTKEDILIDLKKAISELDSIDLMSTNRNRFSISQKRVHKVYDIVFRLIKRIEGDEDVNKEV